jgi:hypothetical protein
MFKWRKSELAVRKGKGDSLGSKGGSISEVISAWIYWSMPELKLFFFHISQFT